MLFASGLCDGVSVVIRSTILQLATPDAMRGRVSAINGIFIGSSNELGAFESGLAAKLLGLVPSVIFGGCMTLGVVATTAKFAPKLPPGMLLFVLKPWPQFGEVINCRRRDSDLTPVWMA